MSDNEEVKLPPDDGPLYGVLAEYDSPGALIKAAEAVRDAGYSKWDCYSPFSVHGLDPAMGIKRTILPVLVFCGGVIGLCGGVLLQWWANAYHWPWIVSGKPFWSIPANVPIIFETTVLLSAFTCFFGMWILNKLPKPWHPFFRNDLFTKASDDGFLIGIEAEDPEFEHEDTTALLRDAGAVEVQDCHIDPTPSRKRIPRPVIALVIITTVAALVPFALAARARASKSSKPHLHLIPDMDFQPKAKAQSQSDFFKDGRSMRLAVDGTVARGELREDDHYYRGKIMKSVTTTRTNEETGEVTTETSEAEAWADSFPKQLTIDAAALDSGHRLYDIYCSPCHGLSGKGNGMIAERAKTVPVKGWAPPTDLVTSPPGSDNHVIRQPHGQLYATIGDGIRLMPGYAAQLNEQERWEVVLYVRALQRSQNAK